MLMFFTPQLLVQVEEEYHNAYQEKLDKRVSVIFIDANSSDTLLVMFCISCGSINEIEKEGLANLLSKLYVNQLNENGNILHYGSEINSYVGYDQSIYYVHGKKENLDGILKNFGQIYSDFSVSKEEIVLKKQDIEQKLIRKKSD